MKEKLFEEAGKLYQKFVDEKYPDISSKHLHEFYGMVRAIEIMGYGEDWKKVCEKYTLDYIDFN